MKTALPIIGLALALAACDSPAEPTAAPVTGIAVAGMAPEGVTPPKVTAMSDAEFGAYAEAMMSMQRDLNLAVSSADSWQDADLAVRSLLNDYPAVPDYQVEQTAATLMMHVHLNAEVMDPSPAVLEAIGYYTDMMVRNGSPDAATLNAAIESLDGYWPEARIQEASAKSARAARRSAAKRSGCTDCDLDQSLAALGERFPEMMNAVPEQTAQAVRALELRAQ